MIGKIIDKKEVAEKTLQVTFGVEEPVTFKAGQYIFVTLINPTYTDDRGNRRQFSINNSPNEKGVITITTRLSESGFKRGLNKLNIGDRVELGPIAGAFVLPEDTQTPLILIAGGIGITPYLSMLKFIEEQKLPYQVTLIYSNRTTQSTAYLEDLKRLNIAGFRLIPIMSDQQDWQGEKRRIDPQFIKEYFPNVNAQNYMVVGPPGMVSAVQKALMDAGVEAANIKIENFTGY
ncbi:MAG: FAD-dependent oxidoreductase [Candidatus Daviesbacteria bacterium]|nr:FAD-dependent oxidoreductase [Candidatus Daviesbacteria bacterium]